MNTFVYQIDGNLYINLTNKCSSACDFCVRNGKDSYYGNPLWLEREPTAEEVIDLIGDPKKYNEIVFCGFGEPTYKIDEIEKIGIFVKLLGGKTRLNTNGHGNLINAYDITDKLKSSVDLVSISLNAPSAKQYQDICHSIYGEDAFDELIDFALKCKGKGIDVVLTVVDVIGDAAIAECKKIAEINGLNLKVRTLIENS